MGFCMTENVDGMMLMFERVAIGSLYSVMHEMKTSRAARPKSIALILLSVCDALTYLHEQGILHCYVNSHSVMLTSMHAAKLCNLEYAVELASPAQTITDSNNNNNNNKQQRRSRVVDNRCLNAAWNWLAPELMSGDVPTPRTDMYSFCVLAWELFNATLPWANMSWEEIKVFILNSKSTYFLHIQIHISLSLSRSACACSRKRWRSTTRSCRCPSAASSRTASATTTWRA